MAYRARPCSEMKTKRAIALQVQQLEQARLACVNADDLDGVERVMEIMKLYRTLGRQVASLAVLRWRKDKLAAARRERDEAERERELRTKDATIRTLRARVASLEADLRKCSVRLQRASGDDNHHNRGGHVDNSSGSNITNLSRSGQQPVPHQHHNHGHRREHQQPQQKQQRQVLFLLLLLRLLLPPAPTSTTSTPLTTTTTTPTTPH